MTLRRFLVYLLAACVLAACGDDGNSSAPPDNQPANPNNAAAEVGQAATVIPTQAPLVVQPQVTATPSDPLAAEVNGDVILQSEIEQQLAFYTAEDQDISQAERDNLINRVLEQRIDQLIVAQQADQLNISLTDQEVQTELAELEAVANEQGFTLDEFFAAQGIDRTLYEQQIREALLTTTVNEYITSGVPTTGPQVRARHILVDDEATARDLLAQLGNGGDFASLAAQYSLDPSTREAGGNLGWISPGDLIQEEVEAIVFTMPANSRAPEPILSNIGYHVIEVLERAETRELAPVNLAERRERAWLSWLAEQRVAAEIVRYVGPNAAPPAND